MNYPRPHPLLVLTIALWYSGLTALISSWFPRCRWLTDLVLIGIAAVTVSYFLLRIIDYCEMAFFSRAQAHKHTDPPVSDEVTLYAIEPLKDPSGGGSGRGVGCVLGSHIQYACPRRIYSAHFSRVRMAYCGSCIRPCTSR